MSGDRLRHGAEMGISTDRIGTGEEGRKIVSGQKMVIICTRHLAICHQSNIC